MNPNLKIEKRSNGTLRVSNINNEPSMTQQQFKDDCDVNLILKKIMKGENVQFNQRKGTYGDFSASPSYEQAMQTVIDANDTFMSLPSNIRTKFQNNPQNLLDYLNDKENLEDSYKLGLRVKPKVEPNPVADGIKELVDLKKTQLKTLKKTDG